MSVATSAYGMHYEADNATVIARAQAVSEAKWNTLPVNMLPARTRLNDHVETLLRRHVERVVSGTLELDDHPTKLWKDHDGKLYIVDGHVHTAIYYALDKPMPVRVMDEKSLAELGGEAAR